MSNINPTEPLLHIVPVYTAILALIFIYLTWRVIKQRRKARVAIGDGNNPALRRAIAVHNNFAQYVPFCLLIITMVELNHASTYIVQGLCITLLLGRLTHAYGVSQEKENLKIRKAGVLLTFTVLAVGSLCLLSQIKLST
jgi:uncharacterized membrane protein YecN with MAPEG domain